MPHVLVVDDDPLVCDALSDCFREELRARVDCAQSGLDGAKLLKCCQYDLALIEAVLPDVDGLRLAELAANENIGILLISGHPDACNQLAKFKFPHLKKPFGFGIMIEEAATIIQETWDNIRRVREAAAKMRAQTKALTLTLQE